MKKILLSLFLIPLFVSSQNQKFELIKSQWEAILEANSIDEKISRNNRFSTYLGMGDLERANFENQRFPDRGYDLNDLDQFFEVRSADSSLIISSWFFDLDEEHKQYNLNIQSLTRVKRRDASTLYKPHAFCYNNIGKECKSNYGSSGSCGERISEVFKNEGFFYYQLIETKSRFDNYYTLIGWSKEGLTSQKKVMTTFQVKQIDSNVCILPSNVIQNEDGSYSSKRIFEYSAQTTMKVNFVEKQNWVLMDHLSPPTTQYEGVFEFYGPDLSFDAYTWEKDRWVLYQDVDADKGLDKRKMEFENPDKVLKEEKIYTPK